MVNQQVLQGSWNDIKGRIQEKWGQLTDDDLQKVKGNAKELIGLIQQKTGQARGDIEDFLDQMVAEGQSMFKSGATAARELAENAGEQAQQVYEQASDRVRAGYRQAENMVQERPLESVAVAFGSGLIAGVIVGLVLRSR